LVTVTPPATVLTDTPSAIETAPALLNVAFCATNPNAAFTATDPPAAFVKSPFILNGWLTVNDPVFRTAPTIDRSEVFPGSLTNDPAFVNTPEDTVNDDEYGVHDPVALVSINTPFVPTLPLPAVICPGPSQFPVIARDWVPVPVLAPSSRSLTLAPPVSVTV
jgi:hypothetical protein